MTAIAHNTDSDDDCDVVYLFAYDALGNRTATKVGDQLLAEKIYTETGDKLLSRLEYGNGSKVHYGYDAYKRLSTTRYDDEATPRYCYDYDASGNIARILDTHLDITTTYESDFASRPARAQQFAGDVHLFTAEISYDGVSRVSKVRELVGADKTPYVTEYAYDSEDRPITISFDNPEQGISMRYDSLGRTVSRKLLDDADGYLTNFTYDQGGQGVGSTTALVKEIVQAGEAFAYTYDELGRVIRESRNGVETSYTYDAVSQLTRVNDPHAQETITYAYDRGGNLLLKKVYAFTKGELPDAPLREIAYAYSDDSWKDKLTAYDGRAITYDAIGNPLDDGLWRYTWKTGRQLEKMERNGMETVQFAYNADGLRVRKESGLGTTRYVLSGKQIVHMTREASADGVSTRSEMHFWYAGEQPAVCTYAGKRFGYVYNLQGDVMALIDLENFNEQVVTYAYDAWGRQISCTGTMAATLGKENPFRYRGYVFDEETGLYYLQSRYYNPEWGRFINADSVMVRNLFAYCMNAPVMYIDSDGQSAALAAIIAGLTALVVIAVTAANITAKSAGSSGTHYATGYGDASSSSGGGSSSGKKKSAASSILVGRDSDAFYRSSGNATGYKTPDLAAMAWAARNVSTSQAAYRELGAVIYSMTINGATTYSTSHTRLGDPYEVALDPTRIPAGAEYVGTVHTHVTPGSHSDLDIGASDRLLDMSFVITANNELFRYQGGTGLEISLGYIEVFPTSRRRWSINRMLPKTE